MGDIDVDTFLETLKQLIVSSKVESIIKKKHQLASLEDEIKYMRGFLKDAEKKRNEHSEVMNVVRQIKDVVSEIENIIELFVVQAFKVGQDQDLDIDFESVKNEIKTLTAEVDQIYDQNMYDIKGVAEKKLQHSFSKSEESSSLSGGSNTSKVAKEKVVFGFNDEVNLLMGKLEDNGRKSKVPLEIISIVGEVGGGKTTLATEVYDHRLISDTFEIRAWVNVSPDYNKTMMRNLLIQIWESASPKKHGDYEKSNEDDKLGEDTYKFLKGKKYLIVMDDIWGIEAWSDIQRSLPRESNGSKVLFTTPQFVKPNNIHCVPHYLNPLQSSCSWELLRHKVFGKNRWPPELAGISYLIAKKCRGLPLLIETIAGILAMEDKTVDTWEEIFKRLPSIIAKSQDGRMKKLELSYNHLPLHLKACLVYIGGFPEGTEILVPELIWLWIAEGFIQQGEWDKRLEDVAKDYLSSLVDRGLVMVARKRSCGGIKACRIHDLLRELCLRKAKEDNFLVKIYGVDAYSPPDEAKHRRLFIIGGQSKAFEKFSLSPWTRNLRSFLCLDLQNSNPWLWGETNLSVVKNFELLRVCRFTSHTRSEGKVRHLVHLRYLAVQLPKDILEYVSPFSYLFNLETLNLQHWSSSDSEWKTIPLPHDIFKMVKLRHLYAKRVVFKYGCLYPDVAAGIGFDPPSKLDSLQTLHSICPCEKCQEFLLWTPNLRKLGFYGGLVSNDFVLMLPDLEFLTCLETLSFNHCDTLYETTTLLPELKFPPTVTRLTLKNTYLKWEELSILQTLPNLEILKLLKLACKGDVWNTSELEEGFSQLKYLRLEGLDIEKWKASEDQYFPRLEVLVVRRCIHLQQIPIDFANLNELREIEVSGCSRSAEKSGRDVLEERSNARGDDDCIKLLASENTY